MFFPPNVTSLIQPMDQGVIKKFKRIYRKQMLRRLLLNEGTEESETVLDWFERQDECYPAHLLLLKRLRDLAAQKRVAAIRQLKINQFVKNKL